MNSKGNNQKVNLKKYLSILPIILLTIFLIIVFKLNKENIGKFIKEGKDNLISYMENLVPLISGYNLTNEDIFNFALYKIIPLDKEKGKVLFINDEPNNIQILQLKNVSYNKNTSNYENLVKFFGLNEKNKKSLDSILNSYKKELSFSILINNKNTLAINPKLAELQKVIQADLINYFMKVNAKKVQQLFDYKMKMLNKINLPKLVSAFKNIPDNEYIFITPDTVFMKTFVLDTYKVKSDAWQTESKQQKTEKKLENININISFNKIKNKQHNYTVNDSLVVKIELPTDFEKLIPRINDIRFDDLDTLLKNFDIKAKKNDEFNNERKKKFDEIALNLQNPLKFLNKTLELMSKQKDWQDFEKKLDSLSKEFEKNISDSINEKVKRKKIN